MTVVPLRVVEGGDSLDAYTEYLYGQGLSPKTIRIYVRLVTRAMIWLAAERSTTVDDAGAYDIVELARLVPQNRSSLAQLRSALRHYWEMTGRYRPPVKAIRVPRKGDPVSRALTEEEAHKLVEVAKEWHPNGTATLLGLYLALRVGEIARARWDRFDDAMEWYTVQNIKGGAADRLPVHPELREHLTGARRALRMIRRDSSVFVFPGSAGREHVTEATVWGWVKDLAEEAGVGKIHTHRLRHTALTVANDATGDLRAVSKFARHRRIETTMTYTRTTAAALGKVMESLDYSEPEAETKG
jgi:site-specific recombinase XerD